MDNPHYEKINSRLNSVSEVVEDHLLSNQNHPNLLVANPSNNELAKLICSVCLEKQPKPPEVTSELYKITTKHDTVIKVCKCRRFCHEACMIEWALRNITIQCPECKLILNIAINKNIQKTSFNYIYYIVALLFLSLACFSLAIIFFLKLIEFDDINAHWNIILGLIFISIDFAIVYISVEGEIFHKQEEIFFEMSLDEYKEAEGDRGIIKDFQQLISEMYSLGKEDIFESVNSLIQMNQVIYNTKKKLGFIPPRRIEEAAKKVTTNFKIAKPLKSKVNDSDNSTSKIHNNKKISTINEKINFNAPSRNISNIPQQINNFHNINININNNISISKDEINDVLSNNPHVNNLILINENKLEKHKSPKNLDNQGSHSINTQSYHKKGTNTMIPMNSKKISISNLGGEKIEELDYEYSSRNSESNMGREEKNLLKINNRHQHITGTHTVEKILNNKLIKKYNSVKMDLKSNAYYMNCDSILSNNSRKSLEKKPEPEPEQQLISVKDTEQLQSEENLKNSEKRKKNRFSNINFHAYN